VAERTYRRSIDRRLREVAEARSVIETIDAEWLFELQRRREQLASPDGYGSTTYEPGSSGSSDTTPTERAALNSGLRLPGCRRPSFVKIRGQKKRVCVHCGFHEDEHSADPIGSTAEEVIDLLDTATKALRTIHRKFTVVTRAADGRVGRQSLLSQCGACGADVTGYGEDRIKAGYGPCCYVAWRRFDSKSLDTGNEPSHVRFRQQRMSELLERAEEAS